jgi:hypothetical protein
VSGNVPGGVSGGVSGTTGGRPLSQFLETKVIIPSRGELIIGAFHLFEGASSNRR